MKKSLVLLAASFSLLFAQCPQIDRDRSGAIATNELKFYIKDDIVIKAIEINTCSYLKATIYPTQKLELNEAQSEEQKAQWRHHNEWVELAPKDENGEPLLLRKDGEKSDLDMLYVYGNPNEKSQSQKEFEALDELSKGAFKSENNFRAYKKGEVATFLLDCEGAELTSIYLETSTGQCVYMK